jgi:hypothetical protein
MCNEFSSKLRNIKQNRSRVTLGAFKARLTLTRHRAQESKMEDFNDSSETLNEDREVDEEVWKLPYREIVDGAALGSLLVDLSRFWIQASVLDTPVQHLLTQID